MIHYGTTTADRVDIKHLMRQRKLAAEMFGNGVEHPFTRALLQRGEYARKHTCPYCGHVLNVGGHPIGHIIDHGPRGLRCSFCEAQA